MTINKIAMESGCFQWNEKHWRTALFLFKIRPVASSNRPVTFLLSKNIYILPIQKESERGGT